MLDQRALRILFDRFWSPKGWKKEFSTSPEDFAHAKSCGVMFDPLTINHSEANNRLITAMNLLGPECVANAFVASLSSRRLDWRSALGSFAVFHRMPFHPMTQDSNASCNVCGTSSEEEYDLNMMNFTRMKWGGIHHLDAVYAMLDLELYQLNPATAPTSEDRRIFRELIDAIAEAPSNTTSASLQKIFPKSLKANKSERDMIVAILGYCGIVSTETHPGFCDRFVPPRQRAFPSRSFVDMPYPACWWTARSGISAAALRKWFGHIL